MELSAHRLKRLSRTTLLCQGLMTACIAVPMLGAAQTEGLGSWNILNVQYKWNDRFSVLAETQLRSLRFYDDFHYYEYKAAVTYRPMPNLRLSLGTGRYVTYLSGGDFVQPKANDELRIWPQVVHDGVFGRLRIEHRYRMEMRFTSNGYRDRFRYRLGASYPFGAKEDGERPYLLSASNEIFFTDREPYFERNRAQVAVNRRVSPGVVLQLGYLHQFDYRINDESGRDFLVLGVFVQIDHQKEQAPISPDVPPRE